MPADSVGHPLMDRDRHLPGVRRVVALGDGTYAVDPRGSRRARRLRRRGRRRHPDGHRQRTLRGLPVGPRQHRLQPRRQSAPTRCPHSVPTPTSTVSRPARVRPAAGVVVAVIDSGVDFSHPDLAPARWTNDDEDCTNGIDDDANGFVDDCHGWDFAYEDDTPFNRGAHAHGTHVAGIIAAAIDGQGIAGVAPDAEIMDLNVGNDHRVGPTGHHDERCRPGHSLRHRQRRGRRQPVTRHVARFAPRGQRPGRVGHPSRRGQRCAGRRRRGQRRGESRQRTGLAGGLRDVEHDHRRGIVAIGHPCRLQQLGAGRRHLRSRRADPVDGAGRAGPVELHVRDVAGHADRRGGGCAGARRRDRVCRRPRSGPDSSRQRTATMRSWLIVADGVRLNAGVAVGEGSTRAPAGRCAPCASTVCRRWVPTRPIEADIDIAVPAAFAPATQYSWQRRCSCRCPTVLPT